jgi:manganese/zinc/iron transport system substrate-binding protein
MNLRIFCFLICLVISGCSAKEDPSSIAKRQLSIGCSNQILADMVSKIAGGRATVFVFGNSKFHEKSDLKQIKSSDFLVILGKGCESDFESIEDSFLDKIVPVLDSIEGSLVKKDSLQPANRDCHFWFDDRLIVPVSEVILDKLASFDSQNAALYTENTASFNLQIKEAFVKFKMLLTHVPKSQRILVSTHDGFAYFGDVFSFETYGLWVSDEGSVTDRDMSRLVDFIVRRWVRHVFVEYPLEDKFVKKLTLSIQEKGWEVEIHPIFIHDLGFETESKLSLLEALEINIQKFRKLLGSDLDAMTIDAYLSFD